MEDQCLLSSSCDTLDGPGCLFEQLALINWTSSLVYVGSGLGLPNPHPQITCFLLRSLGRVSASLDATVILRGRTCGLVLNGGVQNMKHVLSLFRKSHCIHVIIMGFCVSCIVNVTIITCSHFD